MSTQELLSWKEVGAPAALSKAAGAHVRFTCIDASAEHVALGASTGSLYIFARGSSPSPAKPDNSSASTPEDGLRFVKIITPAGEPQGLGKNLEGFLDHTFGGLGTGDKRAGEKELIGVKISPSGKTCATVAKNGVITIWHIGATSRGVPSKFATLPEAHKGETVSVMEWSPNSDTLFTGSEEGSVTIAHFSNTSEGETDAKKLKLGNPIVQLSATDGALLISTRTFAMLLCLRTHVLTQVGSKPRDGAMGACFHPQGWAALPSGNGAASSNWVLAARPGRRLWIVDAGEKDGVKSDVKATLRLAQLPTPTALPWAGAVKNPPSSSSVQFGRLLSLGPCLLSVSDKGICAVDFVSVTAQAWWPVQRGIPGGLASGNFSVATHESSAFMLALTPGGYAGVWQLSAAPTPMALVQSAVSVALSQGMNLAQAMKLATRLQVIHVDMIEKAKEIAAEDVAADASEASVELSAVAKEYCDFIRNLPSTVFDSMPDDVTEGSAVAVAPKRTLVRTKSISNPDLAASASAPLGTITDSADATSVEMLGMLVGCFRGGRELILSAPARCVQEEDRLDGERKERHIRSSSVGGSGAGLATMLSEAEKGDPIAGQRIGRSVTVSGKDLSLEGGLGDMVDDREEAAMLLWVVRLVHIIPGPVPTSPASSIPEREEFLYTPREESLVERAAGQSTAEGIKSAVNTPSPFSEPLSVKSTGGRLGLARASSTGDLPGENLLEAGAAAGTLVEGRRASGSLSQLSSVGDAQPSSSTEGMPESREDPRGAGKKEAVPVASVMEGGEDMMQGAYRTMHSSALYLSNLFSNANPQPGILSPRGSPAALGERPASLVKEEEAAEVHMPARSAPVEIPDEDVASSVASTSGSETECERPKRPNLHFKHWRFYMTEEEALSSTEQDSGEAAEIEACGGAMHMRRRRRLTRRLQRHRAQALRALQEARASLEPSALVPFLRQWASSYTSHLREDTAPLVVVRLLVHECGVHVELKGGADAYTPVEIKKEELLQMEAERKHIRRRRRDGVLAAAYVELGLGVPPVTPSVLSGSQGAQAGRGRSSSVQAPPPAMEPAIPDTTSTSPSPRHLPLSERQLLLTDKLHDILERYCLKPSAGFTWARAPPERMAKSPVTDNNPFSNPFGHLSSAAVRPFATGQSMNELVNGALPTWGFVLEGGQQGQPMNEPGMASGWSMNELVNGALPTWGFVLEGGQQGAVDERQEEQEEGKLAEDLEAAVRYGARDLQIGAVETLASLTSIVAQRQAKVRLETPRGRGPGRSVSAKGGQKRGNCTHRRCECKIRGGGGKLNGLHALKTAVLP
ncbi:hypothetical protein CYMTET_18837 [Cymbomonas tetramitiformis]|uniref:Uncharacterized protein n=1 Tax=Cymbomonas tetramitiformis TaxID=36881 RepID=A0AAE0G7A6_9CHLO|nr:hypothetical protein CYMTET_18837 [Cymbomonas tetramitiformis]